MNYLVLDLETANPDCASICQIGIVHVEQGEIVGTLSRLVDPQDRFDPWNVRVHGILPEHVDGHPTFPEVWAEIAPLLEERIVVTHGSFDRVAIDRACRRHALETSRTHWLDNQTVVRRTWAEYSRKGYSLGNLATRFGITFQHHDALEDAIATAHIFRRALDASGRTASEWLTSITEHRARSAVVRQGAPSGAFRGRSVVFTGRMRVARADAARLAAERGFTIESAVTRGTSILCIGQQGQGRGKSSKEREAERLITEGHPVTIVGEDEFWRLICA